MTTRIYRMFTTHRTTLGLTFLTPVKLYCKMGKFILALNQNTIEITKILHQLQKKFALNINSRIQFWEVNKMRATCFRTGFRSLFSIPTRIM